MNYPVIPRTFFSGDCFDAYRILGAHPCTDPNGAEGWRFAVWAPGATAVEVCGGFDGWERGVPMEKADTGVWSAFIPGLAEGDLYKYRVHGADGSTVMRSDPYAFATELRPGTASKLTKLDFSFDDTAWMERRDKCRNRPLNIYELHAGSWKHKPGATQPDGSDGWYNYEELARELIPWLLEHHFTHVELLPLAEHPFDGSWGYQTTGFFAPTSRYGTPDELCTLIDACHAADIGVIFDFVPVHFAVDEYGLKRFDGTALYEYPAAAVGESEWGSCNFMHSRGEIRCFLQSAADYWLRTFHADGLRMDAVSRLIYWQGDPARGVNGSTLEFLKNMNQGLQQRHPTAMLIAEDSTNFEKVTAPVEYGGLGFDYKWDLGWMNDTLDYFKKTPEERKSNLGKLTFSMMYFWREHYILPFSHDENVHGKATILQKMYGEYEDKFPQGRALYLYMAIHPGKMLDFMGNEFGQLREYDESREQDWLLLDYPIHDAFANYRRTLNELYRKYDAFWSGEYNPDHFLWLDCDHPELDACAILRKGQEATVFTAFNFGDTELKDYELTLPGKGKITPLLNSDWNCFGGRTARPKALRSKTTTGSVKLTLAPYSAQLYRFEPEVEKETKATPHNSRLTA